MIEDAFGIRVSARGEEVLLEGPIEGVRGGERLIGGLTSLMKEGMVLRPDDVEFAIRTFKGGEGASAWKDSIRGNFEVNTSKRIIVPKSPTQKRYLEAIREHDLVLAIGPAGTGKTYLAMAMAVASLCRREVSRIILARPAVEAGEKLGYLPGDLIAKINPYLRPLFDALNDMMEHEQVKRYMESDIIEIVPLAYMRGRAQPLTSSVLTPEGFRPIGSLQAGDLVMGSDGRPTMVLGVFPQGRKEVFRVTFSDGASTRCCGEHLWAVHTRDDKRRDK